MKDKEIIRAEIVRLKEELIEEVKRGFCSVIDEGRISAFEDMLTYIDSLPKNPICNDCGKAAERYAAGQPFPLAVAYHFCRGAEWQEEKLINKACEWWRDDMTYPTMNKEEIAWLESRIDMFRKAMEEEK